MPTAHTVRLYRAQLSSADDSERCGRAAFAVRHLLRLLQEYPREPFLAAVTEAAQYGLYDLDRVERMILRRVAREYFLLGGTEPDCHE